ncbi:hypothetical protein SeseC_00900 [Streptococcus equi subsp. zooepidemicus ATCC 35246]|nr:hypothetical protein SeseC_00900 [Streptococcus equi subsp. zooepidemicus ATCC 35246]QBX15312.1 hypothetical protein Javan181_0020 [Streptococcus phage Javan181]
MRIKKRNGLLDIILKSELVNYNLILLGHNKIDESKVTSF